MNKFYSSIFYFAIFLLIVDSTLTFLSFTTNPIEIFNWIYYDGIAAFFIVTTYAASYFFNTEDSDIESQINANNQQELEQTKELYEKLTASNQDFIKGNKMNPTNHVQSSFTDCLKDSLRQMYKYSYSFFSPDQVREDELLHRKQAIKDYNEFTKNKNIELDLILSLIQQKVDDTRGTLKYINESLPVVKEQNNFKIDSSDEDASISHIFSELKMMILNYPSADDFSKLSAKEIDSYNGQRQDYHQEVIQAANVLLAKIDYDVSSLRVRFEDVSIKISLSK